MQETTSVQKASRMTKQRSVILSELKMLNTHPTAEELYSLVKRKLPKISLGTVYRNLDVLAESGKVRKIFSTGSTRRFDADMSEHAHARCSECGKVVDIFSDNIFNSQKPMQVEGFHILTTSIEYEGICFECNKQHAFPQRAKVINL